ncbi:indole-3-glycerol phosphate synthase TrpC [Peribacillus loiseleuriae]|uniref:indole-3-glycerol phosphate synthase TrpC n=1 Tax=Peribacillus loiseleuriae TaxID=1679170 RepID=UPI003D088DA5
MANILTAILAAKHEEIIKLKKLKFSNYQSEYTKRSLLQSMKESQKVSIIAEIKRASPSRGDIDRDVDPVKQAIAYEKNGAAAISVLTDKEFFKGSFEDLKQVSEAVKIPILCKDFIIDEIQIDHAKRAGAHIILLIAAALPVKRLTELYRYAKSEDLEVLVEVHDEEELQAVLPIDPELIGINNRNLKTFEVNLEVTERLGSQLVEMGKLFISESGVKVRHDVERVRDAGAKGILVGETLMQAENLNHSFKEFDVILKGENYAR